MESFKVYFLVNCLRAPVVSFCSRSGIIHFPSSSVSLPSSVGFFTPFYSSYSQLQFCGTQIFVGSFFLL